MNAYNPSAPPSVRDVLRIDNASFYAIADLVIARRIGGALWGAGAAIAAVLLPLSPPTHSALGNGGWALAIGVIAFAFAYAGRLLRWGRRVSANEILALNYAAVVLVAVLTWLSGEEGPYSELLLLAALYTAAVHPPRRTLAFLAFVGVALALSVVYFDDQSVADQVGRFLVWSGLAIAATFFTSAVRLQRAGLLRSRGEARNEARADPLTGLGNRRAYDESLDAATLRTGRSGAALSVIVADLDSFKQINDRYGLPAGDACLRDVAGALAATLRKPDCCFRWGGDEFVIVVDADAEGARHLANRMVAAVSDSCRRPDGAPVMLHVGVAEHGREASDPSGLLTAASRAMKPAAEDRTPS